ncbi:hypothetical protein Aph01nite_11380 [Acrocarpospora phusangensis]|uniref:Uncharacterized protein n=1 Tax=Acrocarpospora phusangensis TaxID=1070424 RepID=A0A919Q8I8_9ACTN|nr:hypothetical protein [Acrocarpospora phusangensis]GIH22828.1 hypothetical protein Aph01nite_11380 [Acrocarpospora phusangensis]
MKLLLVLSLLVPHQILAPEDWRIVKGARLGDRASALLDVAATGPSDAWAVGYGCGAEDSEGCPGVERWDGVRWRKADVPWRSYHADGVSADSPRNVWVAGNGETAAAAHWDGLRWRTYQPFGAAQYHRVNDVAVAGQPWFAGNTPNGSAVVVGWTRTRGFYPAFSLGGSLNAITARRSTGDVWAVGITGTQPLVIHGDARGAWGNMLLPPIQDGVLTRVWQVAKNNVWVVGYAGKTLADSRPIALRYDGKTWRQVPVPVARGRLTGLTGDGAGQVWAAGVNTDLGERVMFVRLPSGSVSYGPRLPIPDQRDYDPQTVTKVSIARIPGTKRGMWAVAAAGGGDREAHFILRSG